MKQYIIHDSKWIGKNSWVQPDTELNQLWEGVFKITACFRAPSPDQRIVSYWETVGSPSVAATDRFKARLTSQYSAYEVTAQEAVDQLNAWYPVKEEHSEDFPNGYYSLNGDVIVNNTPVEDLE